MLTRIALLVSLILCCTLMPLQAAELKIGYIDLQKALNQSEAGKSAKEKISQRVKDHEATIESRQKELKKLKDDLDKQGLLLSDDARAAKERDYQQKLKEFQRLTKDAQEEVQQKDSDFTRQILEDLSKVIQEFGAREGYSMILEKTESAVLYADDKVDLTDRVIRAYDASRRK